ncbi:MAG: DsrE/DsrF/DrsH-like family protein [Candidatus Thermoplasmatota archaeon]|nr:DsrE/DsrF/DrsH-like family protein [Candidatus Thermoplasmatota archaeon]
MADKVVMVVSEGSFDKALMPLIIGTTAASMGMEVHVFYTFFGLKLLKKGVRPKLKGLMRPFTGMIQNKMKKLKVPGFDEMMQQSMDLGVNFYACSTSMALLGVKESELVDGVKVLGASAFVDIAAGSKASFFIG